MIVVAPDCQLGIHALRIRSLGGVSNLRTFTVGNLPEVAEVEPNTNFKQAQAIPLNVTVSGVVQSEDIDHFAVELKRGDRLNGELNGGGRVLVRPSGTEPVVRVLAEAPTEEESEALCGRVVQLVREELG